MNQSIFIRGSVHIKLHCISEMLDDFPEVTLPEIAESGFKNLFFGSKAHDVLQ